MQIEQYNEELLSFLNASPTSFHAVDSIKKYFQANGWQELFENQKWKLEKGKSYFVLRENGALAAFTLGMEEKPSNGFRMIGSHSDSPGLQLKAKPEMNSSPYLQLGVEIYGGPLLRTWFDRDLSLAGRVCCSDTQGNLHDYLIDFARPLLSIPSLAIHLDREANNDNKFDKQKALQPLLAQALQDQLPSLNTVLTDQLLTEYPSADIKEILGLDLFCYDLQQAQHLGYDNEFITGGRLDNLLSCHVATKAIDIADRKRNSFFFCANHEENGSTSTIGAQGSFMEDIFARILPDTEERQIAFRNSLFISIDNAHAVHPNFKEKADSGHNITLNGGPVIKINANQRYATSARTNAVFKLLASESGIPVQEFVMPTGMPCGSTIGPMTAAKTGIETIDVGAPTLAMHSIREITGVQDPFYMYSVIKTFLESSSIKKR